MFYIINLRPPERRYSSLKSFNYKQKRVSGPQQDFQATVSYHQRRRQHRHTPTLRNWQQKDASEVKDETKQLANESQRRAIFSVPPKTLNYLVAVKLVLSLQPEGRSAGSSQTLWTWFQHLQLHSWTFPQEQSQKTDSINYSKWLLYFTMIKKASC